MFEAKGFEHTTIEAVADACGVSPSTIYRHFGTKERVVLWDDRHPSSTMNPVADSDGKP